MNLRAATVAVLAVLAGACGPAELSADETAVASSTASAITKDTLTAPPSGPLPVEPEPSSSIGGRVRPSEASGIRTDGVTVLSIDDPRGDVVDANGMPQRKPPAGRAEIVRARVRAGTRIELEVKVAKPRPFEAWDPFDEVVWELTDERGQAFTADLRRYEPGPRAEVRVGVGSRPGPLRCQPRWSLPGGSYRMRFPADCLGAPEALRARVRVRAHDRSTDAYALDDLPNADDAPLGPFRP